MLFAISLYWVHWGLWGIAGLVLLYLALTFAVVVHEMGHFILRHFWHVPTTTVRIGQGPMLCHWGKIEWRTIPCSGANVPYTFCATNITRWKKITIYCAGPLANTIIGLGLVWMVLAIASILPVDSLAIGMVALVQAIGVANLIPTRHGTQVSDGLFIVALWHRLEFLPPDHPCESPEFMSKVPNIQ